MSCYRYICTSCGHPHTANRLFCDSCGEYSTASGMLTTVEVDDHVFFYGDHECYVCGISEEDRTRDI